MTARTTPAPYAEVGSGELWLVEVKQVLCRCLAFQLFLTSWGAFPPMRGTSEVTGVSETPARALGPHYKWIALSNTTLGVLMATINQSIVLIALPDVFRGIGLDPLSPGNTSYLLWMFMGFLVVSAVLVVSFGRLGDMFGRVRMYNMGFAVFAVASIFLTVTWMHGAAAALWLIIWRIVQGIGGAFLFANSTAILTDAFPANQRGMALGLNSIAAIAGSFIGLILGGVLGPVNWHLIFLVSAPIGVFGAVWAYFMLHDQGVRKHARMDWWGNVLFGVGLIAILVGYYLRPHAVRRALDGLDQPVGAHRDDRRRGVADRLRLGGDKGR